MTSSKTNEIRVDRKTRHLEPSLRSDPTRLPQSVSLVNYDRQITYQQILKVVSVHPSAPTEFVERTMLL